MKRFYSIIMCSLLMTGLLVAQDSPVCDPDTAFVNSGAIVQPSPLQNDTLGDGLPDACINTPYNLTIFVHPPSSFAVGTINVPVTSFRIDSVVNLPEGLEYDCSAPDCQFPADSINCIYLSGTPTEANDSQSYELTIFLTVSAAGLGFAATFPDPALAPGSYHITMHPEGDSACQNTTPVLDYNPIAEKISVFPNPSQHQLTLSFDSKVKSVGMLQVWNHSGVLIKQQQVDIERGQEQFSLQVNDLPAGFYVVGLQTKEGRFRSKFIKN